MNKLLPLLLCTASCMAVSARTVVTELRVMALQADPPFMDAATGTTLTATIYQPTDAPVRVLQWTCVPGPLGCFEAGTDDAQSSLSTFTQVSTPQDGLAAYEAEPLAFYLPATLTDAELPPVFVWTLVCETTLCPLIDAVLADPTPGNAAWEDALANLADPFTMLQTLPKVGTAITFRTLDIRLDNGDGSAPTNPTVQLLNEAPLTVGSGDKRTLRFAVSADARVFPVATQGGFEDTESEVIDGETAVVFVAGEEDNADTPPLPAGTDVALFVTVETEDGGSAVWRGNITVK